MSVDRPVLGIALMLVFCATIPLSDALAKHLGASMSLAMLLLARFAIQTLTLLPVVVATRRSLRLGARGWGLTVLRSAFHLLAGAAMFASLRYLPLADAVAIAFVMPFLLLLLGRLVLGETVGRARLWACAAGFAGTLLVVQPNFVEAGAPALLPLLVALFYAGFMLVTRSLARRADALSLQAAGGLVSTALLLAAILAGPDHPDLDLVIPDRPATQLLLLMGLVGTFANLALTLALRFAPTATLAPMQYLEIPASALVGWLIFGDLPGSLAATGIALTVASGLFVIARERRANRTLPAPHPAPPAAG